MTTPIREFLEFYFRGEFHKMSGLRREGGKVIDESGHFIFVRHRKSIVVHHGAKSWSFKSGDPIYELIVDKIFS